MSSNLKKDEFTIVSFDLITAKLDRYVHCT